MWTSVLSIIVRGDGIPKCAPAAHLLFCLSPKTFPFTQHGGPGRTSWHLIMCRIVGRGGSTWEREDPGCVLLASFAVEAPSVGWTPGEARAPLERCELHHAQHADDTDSGTPKFRAQRRCT